MSTPMSLLPPLDSAAMTAHERLAQARTHARFPSARAAAISHGWPESTYRAHEKGTRRFGLEDAQRYGDAFGVNGTWIFYGGGKMQFTSGTKHNLPNVGGRRDNIQSTARRIPVLGQAVGGKDGYFVMNEHIVDTIMAPPGLENVPGAYAVYVVGESMEPRYEPGEVVYVHPNKPCRKGDYVVAQIKGEDNEHPLGFIKRYVAYTPTVLILAQLNPPTEIEFPRGDVVSIHRIVGSGVA
jgi:phage repressor protein C with HTH and peptisase S24 domain